MTYRQREMYNRAKYLKNFPLQSVSSRRNVQVVFAGGYGLPPEDSFWMRQTVVVSFSGMLTKILPASPDFGLLCLHN